MSNTWNWLGGGNNEWNNPADWSPNGVPLPGDTLVVNSGTINFTHAIENVQITEATLNLTGRNILNLSNASPPAVFLPPSVTINVNTSGSIINDNFGPSYLENGTTIRFAEHTKLILTGTSNSNASFSSIGNGTLVDDATITASDITITSKMLGHGTIALRNTHDAGPGRGTVSGASGAGLTYDLSNTGGLYMTVEHPDTFLSKVQMGDNTFLTLAGLAATSYDFKNDILTLYQGNTKVDRLRLTDQSTTDTPLSVGSGPSGVVVGIGSNYFGLAPPANPLPLHHLGG